MKKLQDGISFNDIHDSIEVSLPLLNNSIAHIKYDKKPPYRITDIKVIRDHVKIDDLLKGSSNKQEAVTLNKVYQALTTSQTKITEGISSWSKMRVLFNSATHITTACVKRIRQKNNGETKNVHYREMESH